VKAQTGQDEDADCPNGCGGNRVCIGLHVFGCQNRASPARQEPQTCPRTKLIGDCFFVRPQVLNTARVRENWFSVPLITIRFSQTAAPLSTGESGMPGPLAHRTPRNPPQSERLETTQAACTRCGGVQGRF
jgi:hypothetical protein